MKNYILLLFAAFTIVFSCTKEEIPMDDPEDTCETDDVTYSNTIQTILSGCNAAGCHAATTSRSMANYDDAKEFAGDGKILGALRHENGFSPMPKNGSKLSECKISQVEAWIQAGFPE